jgi:glycolate oxidase FAD binding subunit
LDKSIIHSLNEIAGKGNLDIISQRVYLQPLNIEKIKEIVDFAGKEGFKILPAGKETKIDYHRIPSDDIVVLKMDNFSAIKQVAPGDLYVILDAGYDLSRLNKDLVPYNLFFPFCLEKYEGTIGGAVATALEISNEENKINIKEYVLSLKVVNSEAEILQVGANVFKSVAGYDTTRLFVGSWGTLGIIARVGLRLIPLNRKKEFENMQPFPSDRVRLDENSEDCNTILSLRLKKELDPKGIFLSF